MSETIGAVRKSLWSRARDIADEVPPERNRYVDFLRALSILAVAAGHWLVAALVPVTWKAWRRGGFASLWVLVAGAVAIDVASLHFGVPHVDFLNFALVRLARPIWFALHVAALFPLVMLFARYERADGRAGGTPALAPDPRSCPDQRGTRGDAGDQHRECGRRYRRARVGRRSALHRCGGRAVRAGSRAGARVGECRLRGGYP